VITWFPSAHSATGFPNCTRGEKLYPNETIDWESQKEAGLGQPEKQPVIPERSWTWTTRKAASSPLGQPEKQPVF